MGNLECKGIKKSYHGKTVLDGIDLVIEPGKIYGLIGRNGVGKTTLLSILTAQNPADAGEVTYDGMPVWENRAALEHLCFSREISTTTLLGQNTMKIREYFRTAACFYPHWDQRMADELIAKFGLDPKKIIKNLSKGMLSMVTIIIGLASKAEITILDEPVAGLDVIAREQFYRLLIEEQTETGRTFVISTHIIEEAADVFEEVIFLRDGRRPMKGLSKNIRLNLQKAAIITGMTYVLSLALTLWLQLINIEAIQSLSEAFTVYLSYTVLVGSLFIFLYGSVNMSTVFQLMLAYGSTRKCAAISMTVFAVATAAMHIVSNLVLSLCKAALFPGTAYGVRDLLQLLATYLFAAGLGILAGSVTMRFGKIGYFAMVFMASFVSGIAWGYMAGETGDVTKGFAPLTFLENRLGAAVNMDLIYLPVMFAEIVVIVLAGMLLVRVTRRTEVRV